MANLCKLEVGALLECRGWLNDERVRTTLLINLASIMERTDEQILPAVYRWIGAAFHATPSQLGNLTFCRAVVQAVASPLGGFAGASRDTPPPSEFHYCL